MLWEPSFFFKYHPPAKQGMIRYRPVWQDRFAESWEVINITVDSMVNHYILHGCTIMNGTWIEMKCQTFQKCWSFMVFVFMQWPRTITPSCINCRAIAGSWNRWKHVDRFKCRVWTDDLIKPSWKSLPTLKAMSQEAVFHEFQLRILRILASDEPKNSKNEQLLNVLPDNFVNYSTFRFLKDGVLTELWRCSFLAHH